MIKSKENTITKTDFMKLKEDNLMFITNPGRMGDEDGSTFVIKDGINFIIYRVDGWMYPLKNVDEKERITLEDALKQFPKWAETWKHGSEKDYKGKYIYIYMGFGNGLSVDNSIYNEYEPHLNELVEHYLKDRESKEDMKYAAIFNVWEEALMKMIKKKNKKTNYAKTI